MMYPSYLNIYNSGKFRELISLAYSLLSECKLCPRKCGTERLKDKKDGKCNSGLLPKVSSYNAHHGEEPPISGFRGSGTIFFTNCNLKCIYCQNYPISQLGSGKEVEPTDLASMMLSLQVRGCHNINLVTPTHFVPQILHALHLAIERGLTIPLVYNSSGYDSLEELKLLDGIVDIYMPDSRYGDSQIGMKLSGIPGYVEVNRKALLEMHRQVGDLKVDEHGIGKRGLVIRHLVLPNDLSGTEEVLRFISEKISKKTYLSLMAQYFPAYKAVENSLLDRRLKVEEYETALRLAEKYSLLNGWSQKLTELRLEF